MMLAGLGVCMALGTPVKGMAVLRSVETAEEKIAALHGADDASVLASGVAALHALFWTLLKNGDRVVYPNVSYMAVYRML